MTAHKKKSIAGNSASSPARKARKYAGRMAGIVERRAAVKKENNLFNRKIISAAKKLQANRGVHISAAVLLTPKEYRCIVELVYAAVDKVRRRGCGGAFSYRSMRYKLGINVLGQVTIYFAGQFRPFIYTDFGTVF